MSARWKTVRVFISSTFRDMHAERDYLVKRVFPRLREWCERRRLHLVDIDLRWGVTKEQADNGKAIEICLKEIDGSRPFFLCILGNRYGWVPEELPPEEMYLFRGLQTETHLSITHLEIRHAALDAVPTKQGETKPVCEQAFFYFRKHECIPTPETLTTLTAQQQAEFEDTFFEKNRVQMLTDLKDDIRMRYEGDGRVFEYLGIWNPEADNPEDSKLKGRLTELKDFGDRVFADLLRGIEQQFAEHLSNLSDSSDALKIERSYHEAFVENRTQVHVVRGDVEQALDRYFWGRDRRVMVLSGPPGSGKSAILAHWTKELAAKQGDLFVVPRFVGASTSSVNLPRLLGNICAELQARFELTEDVEEDQSAGQGTKGTQAMAVPSDPNQIQQKWPKFLQAASDKGRVLIVLDAVNQLDRSADPGRLYWLPRELPENIRIVVSVLDHGLPSTADAQPTSRAPLDWLSTMRRLKLPEQRVPELSDDERRQMIREIPTVFCKTLDDAQINLILSNSATRNPLLLFVALDELRVFGSFEGLKDRIAQLPAADPKDPEAMQLALDEMFGQVLTRLEQETNPQAPGVCASLFRLLSAARDGLSEEEIAGALGQVVTTVGADDRSDQMQIILRQVRQYLVRKGVEQRLSEFDHPELDPGDGTSPKIQIAIVDFYHRSFWKAVQARYVADDSAAQQSHKELAEYFHSLPYFLETLDGQRARVKRLPPSVRPANVRKVVELPHHVLEVAKLADPESKKPNAKEWDDVADLLLHWEFLEAKAET